MIEAVRIIRRKDDAPNGGCFKTQIKARGGVGGIDAEPEFSPDRITVAVVVGQRINVRGEVILRPPLGDGKPSRGFLAVAINEADAIGHDVSAALAGVIGNLEITAGAGSKRFCGSQEAPAAAIYLLIDANICAAAIEKDGMRGAGGTIAALWIPDVYIVETRVVMVGVYVAMRVAAPLTVLA